jgi:hypothetical protein
VVLYENQSKSVVRLAVALSASVRHSREARPVDSVEFALGDCSPAACLSSSDLDLLKRAAGTNFTAVAYEYFDRNLGHSGGINRRVLDEMTLLRQRYQAPRYKLVDAANDQLKRHLPKVHVRTKRLPRAMLAPLNLS